MIHMKCQVLFSRKNNKKNENVIRYKRQIEYLALLKEIQEGHDGPVMLT